MTDGSSQEVVQGNPEARRRVSFLSEVFADPPPEPEVLVNSFIRRGELVVVISCSRGWEQKMDYPPADVIVGALIKPIIEEHCGEAADE